MKRGLHVAILGPDGCGKSTVLPLLEERLGSDFAGTKLYHWRPKMLQDVGVLVGSREATSGPVTDPHGAPAHNPVVSCARLLYYLFDYWLGSVAIRRAKAKGLLVVFDRYASDMWCDPQRYRFRLPGWFLRLACSSVPAPDLGFVLVADAAVLYERKKEVPIETLRHLLGNYSKLADSDPVYRLIDCSKPAVEVADEMAGMILEFAGGRPPSS